MKSYRQVLLSRVPAGQRKTRDLVFSHGVHTLSALIQKLEVPPQPPPLLPPTISATFSGSIQDAKFHVTGSRFLPNRPNNNQGVAVRVVDANSLQETRREFTGSSADGKIDHVIEGNLTGLTLNAAGIATVAISATDGRPNQADVTGFLWSNTVRIDFHA
jgi:hypothetical protein